MIYKISVKEVRKEIEQKVALALADVKFELRVREDASEEECEVLLEDLRMAETITSKEIDAIVVNVMQKFEQENKANVEVRDDCILEAFEEYMGWD